MKLKSIPGLALVGICIGLIGILFSATGKSKQSQPKDSAAVQREAIIKLLDAGKEKEAFEKGDELCMKDKDKQTCMALCLVNAKHKKLSLVRAYCHEGCRLGSSESCAAYGMAEFQNGDKSKGALLVDKACDMGNKEACAYLGK